MRSSTFMCVGALGAFLLLLVPIASAAPAPPDVQAGVASLSLERPFASLPGAPDLSDDARQAQYFDNRPPQRASSPQPYSQPFVGQRGPNHDSGFLLRLSMGLGGGQTSYSESGEESLRLSGFGLDWNIAIGGFVAPNFAIHATFLGFFLPSPDISSEGLTVSTSWPGSTSSAASGPDISSEGLTVSTNLNATVTAFGGGLTWYFMPANVYLSSSFGLGTLSLESGAAYGETNVGVAGDLVVGKEWFTGPRWGVGIAGGFTWHSFPDGLIDSRWRGGSATLRFTATFNP